MVLVLRAADDRRQLSYEHAYYSAYMAGYFGQPHKRFPAYDKFRPKAQQRGNKRQPWQVQKQMAEVLNAAYGGRLDRRGGREKDR